MKQVIAMLSCLCLCGCLQYSEGTTIGYVTTVEGGIFWDTVFVRAELESSQSDGLAIQKSQTQLKEDLLRSSREKRRVEIKYKKHFYMARLCDENNHCQSDEIVSFKEL